MAHAYQVHLVRHGIAEELSDLFPDDAKRPLTEAGVASFRRGIRGLSRAGLKLDVVLTSPLLRARQSAEIMAAECAPKPAIVVAESLAPGGTHQALLAELAKHAKRARVALVGHEPGMGELAARLVGLRQPLRFKKGAVARIDLDDLPPTGLGELRWLLPPKLLRRLRK